MARLEFGIDKGVLQSSQMNEGTRLFFYKIMKI